MFGYKVFISHTNGSDDLEIVEKVALELESVGVNAYIAERDRQPGKYLTEKIKANIRDSDLVIGIWTEGAAGSAYVNNELGYAEDKKPWFLFLEKGAKAEGFAVGREWIEFDKANLDINVVDLVDDVRKRMDNKLTGTAIVIGALAIVGAAIVAWYLSSRDKE